MSGKLLLIWDGAPVHRSQAVKGWLSQGAAQRIQLEQLPGYAPELNPDKRVWRYLKRVELRNLACVGLEQLGRELWAAVGRLLSKPQALGSCIREAGYVWQTVHSSARAAPVSLQAVRYFTAP